MYGTSLYPFTSMKESSDLALSKYESKSALVQLRGLPTAPLSSLYLHMRWAWLSMSNSVRSSGGIAFGGAAATGSTRSLARTSSKSVWQCTCYERNTSKVRSDCSERTRGHCSDSEQRRWAGLAVQIKPAEVHSCMWADFVASLCIELCQWCVEMRHLQTFAVDQQRVYCSVTFLVRPSADGT